MLRALRLLSLFTALAAASLAGHTAAAADNPPPAPAPSASATDLNEYVRQCQAFVAAHADSPSAPRVLLNALGAAFQAADDALIDAIRKQLIYDFPTSPQMSLVMAQFHGSGSSDDEDRYRDYLEKVLDEWKGRLPAGFARKHCMAVERGVEHFGEGVLGKGAFALATAILAQETGNATLEGLCRQRALSGSKSTKRQAEILFNASSTALDKLMALDALDDNSPRNLVKLLRPRITSQEAATRAVVRIDLESHLHENEFAAALPLATRLLKAQDDPAVRCYLIWCLAML